MNITILAVGHKMPNWVSEAVQEYSKRFVQGDIHLIIKEIKPEKRTNISASVGMTAEEGRIRSALPNQAYLIVLDERGESISSRDLANYLKKWQQNGIQPCFVIGGADGIAPILKQDAKKMFRLSTLTLPHGMVRVLLVEQLYRAMSILNNHPYHRD